jgi:ribose-phosphate pyrophosphokinase
MSDPSPIVFGTRIYGYLRDGVCHAGNYPVGQVTVNEFPDGERYQRIESQVSGQDVALIGGTVSDDATLELYDLACGLVQCGARSLTLVIPFFGYATMERATHPGEVVTAKTRARLLSAIPVPGSGIRVLVVDLHSEGVAHYFEGAIRPVHVYATPVITSAVKRLGGADFVLACTDAGRAKWVESLANELGVPASFVFKRRLDGARTEVTAVSAQVQGRNVVIYDDMIRTGSSLENAARAYRAAGAKRISAVATHGLFPGDALPRLRSMGLFTGLACTDSHPRANSLRGDFLAVDSIAGVLADALKRNP